MDNLKKVLNENKLAGGELVQSLAERLRKEGMELGKDKWVKQGGNQRAKDIAKRMLHDNCSIESIVKYSGLSEKEVNALMSWIVVHLEPNPPNPETDDKKDKGWIPL